MASNTAERVADRIAGPEPTLLIEAPAGHGKTYQAVAAARRLSEGLERGQSVLLLSHTNAAANEFSGRPGSSQTVVQTFDSLACGLVERYASHLGIHLPLQPEMNHLGQPTFAEIRQMAGQLLHEAPAIARGLAYRHPIILADEFQDSTLDQHRILEELRGVGQIRLRLFADDLQAIFDFGDTLVSWSQLTGEHPLLQLDHGYRWDAAPELRDWFTRARACLQTQTPISLTELPASVVVDRWEGAAPGPKQKGNCPKCYEALRRLRCSGPVAFLVRSRSHAYDLRVRVPQLKASLLEAGEVEEPLERLEMARMAEGQPAELSILLVETLQKWGTGITSALRAQLDEVCQPDGIDLGKKKKAAPLAAVCQIVYDQPDQLGFVRGLGEAVRQRSSLGWTPIHKDYIYLLMSAAADAGSDDLVAAVQMRAQARRRRPVGGRRLMTIHKSKGREFETTVLPYVADNSFKIDARDARLLYVAMTRATRQLHLMLPSDNPSPWFSD